MTPLIHFSEQPLVHAVGWNLLHFCWQGTVVAIFLAYVLRLLNKRSPQQRYLAACCALALMVILPLGTFGYLVTAQLRPGSVVTGSMVERNVALGLLTSSGSSEPVMDRITVALDQSLPWLMILWFSGVILLIGRFNLRLIAARRMKSVATQPAALELQRVFHEVSHRLGIARTVRLMNSGFAQVPTVIGWLRPVVLVPVGCLTGLSPIQVEALLAHELAHIRRHDYLINVCQSIVEIFLFYHPAVWWVSEQIRRERECCCDDMAVKISGDALAYAQALSFLEERRSTTPILALGANAGVLSLRIRRLLGRNETPAVSRLAALALSAVAVTSLGLYVSTIVRAQSSSGKPAAVEVGGAQTLPTVYRLWLDQDVRWIISPEERAAFVRLATDKERNRFIQQFWEARNPAPGTAPNAFKVEHYHRIAYANQHFAAAGIPGWRTDRGRIYIVYGPPDEIRVQPTGGGAGSARPFEIWHYRLIHEYVPLKNKQGRPGYQATIITRKNVDMKFVDVCRCGDYRLQVPSKN